MNKILYPDVRGTERDSSLSLQDCQFYFRTPDKNSKKFLSKYLFI
ncbi:Uncharacterized protein dnm_092850 [Desulfonema magnum]|uniref:Uncharacterized protein n=1 Tax=Desulfonema magnum TaxID=45655 RepID=A0A975BXK2_9BACT|nr:Uncharacterized protein dnm_092850 [Desulfonema magnum]